MKSALTLTEAQVQLPCALCSSWDHQVLYRPAHSPGPVVRCRRCGLVYVSPRRRCQALILDGPVLGDQPAHLRWSRNLGDIESSWELPLLRNREAEYAALRLNSEDVLSRLSRLIGKAGRLLDFGCGGGFFLGTAKELGWEAYGLEPLAGHAVYARARFGVRVVTDTLRENSFPMAFFDAITALQVFEHLPDPLGDLQKLTQFLKPGGAILIEVPNVETWSVQLFGARHRHFVQDHLYFYSPKTLAKMLVECDLEVMHVYYPSRRMTVRHLLVDWGGRSWPSWLARLVAGAVRQAGGLDKIISVNVGDIVAIIGKKRADHHAG